MRLLALAALVAVSEAAAQPPASIVPVPLKVVDPAFVDTTAKACTDFFQYANGAWLAKDTIPAAYSSSGVGRDMSDRNELVVRSVLEDVLARRATLAAETTPHKLATFYGTCMDSTAAERTGVSAVKPLLTAIDGIASRAGLVQQIAALQAQGVNVAFGFGPEVGRHDAAHYVAGVYQGGLGLPDRDYYFEKGAAGDSTRRAYVTYLARLLELAGTPAAESRRVAGRVLAFETSLAAASMTRVAQRDPAATDHLMPLGRLRALAPHVAWTDYFSAVGITSPVQQVNVGMPDFVKRVDSLVARAPLSDWRAYLRAHVLAETAPWLSAPFVDESFAFTSRFTGAKAQLPRWKRCLREADADLGEALGESYVAKTFSPEARARAKAVIDDIRAAFGERLKRLTWMSDSTRAQALDKLARMGEKVGYPERWRDYGKLDVQDGPFALNVLRAHSFEWQRTINRPGAPVDTTEWNMTVPTVNAYYDPSKNEMVFPAGALAPQTFDPAADDGANYGALGGSWAGHELTHGFDDEGRHFDAAGNQRDWWTPTDSLRFTQQAQRVVDQFDTYVQVDTFHVNGKLTLGENIADYGGVLTGFDALQRALARNGRPALMDGYTPEQRFFLGYAQSWREHTRPEAMRTRVTTDPHAPARWRVNGPLSNSEAFARAWGCKPGDPMVRPREVVPQIW
ncbi:peptidase M13 [Gemmatirosa kalamazoonensis]|uniref:Peptidase M13 n=1 Tax=Gemmatirosa kalamazoonensis TaxID=861299 RepID=W0RLD8_9BACT|nr:M13 family metallopeptidase [Gemmatirosa kalamazoonensis]AHG91591.1 peptidase M13 [Gemmatirosa kalamazoonensis]